MVDDIDDDWIVLHFLFKHKICVGVILGAVAIFTIIYDCKRGNDKQLKQQCSDIMKYISEKHFLTSDNSVRCTIFRPVGGKTLLFRLIWRLLIKELFYNLIHQKIKDSIRKICLLVPDTSLRYLSIFVRYQHPKIFDSNTAFPISEKSKEYGCVTEKCFKKGDVVEVHTINMDRVILTDNEKELKSSDQKKVKRYMKESCIAEYSTLLKMNTLANHIFAVPIILEDETTWGILTIDYIGDDKVLDIDECLSDLLKNYSKMIAINIKHQ